MKKLLRKILPQPWRKALSTIRRNILVSSSAFVLKRMPPKDLIAIKRNVSIIKQMDYDKHEILLNIESEYEYMTRSRSAQKDPETVEWIEAFIHKGDTFFDIGANIGAYSLIASKHTAGGAAIYAFEPAFPSYSQLCRNIILNDCQESIYPLAFALSSETKFDSFNYRSLEEGRAFHTLGDLDGDEEPFVRVAVHSIISYRLDDIIRYLSIPPPNHIKIDVDGFEMEVLKGAADTLGDQHLRTIMVEVDEGRVNEGRNITRYLTKKGMLFKAKYPRGGTTHNYLFHRESDLA